MKYHKYENQYYPAWIGGEPLGLFYYNSLTLFVFKTQEQLILFSKAVNGIQKFKFPDLLFGYEVNLEDYLCDKI